jgi:hypothetical protein
MAQQPKQPEQRWGRFCPWCGNDITDLFGPAFRRALGASLVLDVAVFVAGILVGVMVWR